MLAYHVDMIMIVEMVEVVQQNLMYIAMMQVVNVFGILTINVMTVGLILIVVTDNVGLRLLMIAKLMVGVLTDLQIMLVPSVN